ncbi:carboxylesterase family protein [Nocardioides plantarum]|uniref:Carboxylesterase family protein n=1 Tax=Nocardioides plantarum TaxID=29299 RepID=A0ABV5KFM2_9ACTN|nr:carboxylesterase family protein [Nocardioides plantarum]
MIDRTDDDRRPRIVELQTADGPVRAVQADGLVRARGIRYGRAARFAPAEPIRPWDGPVDATEKGPAPPQQPSRLELVMGSSTRGLRQDEDCLVVSVTAPASGTSMPVMVWFHGGAYLTGSGESDKYDPTQLALEGGVVVVNVSHRLGVLGYLTPRSVSDQEQNLGLTDQVLALHWVHRNISGYGGDPANVTVFGQSAGADSIWAMLLSEGTTGLFRRAILQSAPLGLRTGRDALRNAMLDVLDAHPELMGVQDSADQTAAVLATQATAVRAARRFGAAGALPFAPALGGTLLPPPEQVLDQIGRVAPGVDLLLTHTRNDALPFVLADPRISRLAARRIARSTVIEQVDRLVTRRVFAKPAASLAKTWRAAGGQAAHYQFDWATPDSGWGACHCIELPFLFPGDDTWADAPMLGTTSIGDDPTDLVGASLRAAWAAFATSGQVPGTGHGLRLLTR